MDPADDPDLSLLMDPAFYDAMYPRASPEELAFWARRSANRDPVLELGCGTGRLLVPLAKRGRQIDGLDHSQRMLDHLASKLVAEGLGAQLLLADLRSFQVGSPYALVFSAFDGLAQLLDLDDVGACVARVAAALSPTGRFVIDLANRPADYRGGHWATFDSPAPPAEGLIERVRVTTVERFDPETRLRELDFEYRYSFRPTANQRLVVRDHSRAELESILVEAGFEIADVWGDFDETPLEPSSRHMIIDAIRL